MLNHYLPSFLIFLSKNFSFPIVSGLIEQRIPEYGLFDFDFACYESPDNCGLVNKWLLIRVSEPNLFVEQPSLKVQSIADGHYNFSLLLLLVHYICDVLYRLFQKSLLQSFPTHDTCPWLECTERDESITCWVQKQTLSSCKLSHQYFPLPFLNWPLFFSNNFLTFVLFPSGFFIIQKLPPPQIMVYFTHFRFFL